LDFDEGDIIDAGLGERFQDGDVACRCWTVHVILLIVVKLKFIVINSILEEIELHSVNI
jgi:hypothetical protein